MSETNRIIIIGAGPAGLSAGYTLAAQGREVCILEADPEYVGGISKTVCYRGFYFDIGGHRFFSKSQTVEQFWTNVLPHDMLVRPRVSRIYYRGRLFSYPLRPLEAFLKLGPLESFRCILSYISARLHPIRPPVSFEDWVVNEFGRRLYEIFFKTYTEKVWGMRCQDISADWAAQRIKGLSLWEAVRNSLLTHFNRRNSSRVAKTLITTFRYPRRGPGMLWEACARQIRDWGGTVLLDRTVTNCSYDRAAGTWQVHAVSRSGDVTTFNAAHIISSAPLRELVRQLAPTPSPPAVAAATALRYRDFLTVALILRDVTPLPDNWLYIHDPRVRAGRIQNFKAWSPDMVPDPSLTCYGLEYFCFEGDGLWSKSDGDLIALAKAELVQLSLAAEENILDGYVVRQPKAYPVYDPDYKQNIATIRSELSRAYQNLWLAGRNGMHKYNNQDHAVMTGLLTAANILAGKILYDVWQVNEDAEYHEEGVDDRQRGDGGLRLVPEALPRR